MADPKDPQWSALLQNAAIAIPTVSVLGMVASQAAGTSQALLNATHQNAHAATLELTATASSAMQVLGSDRSGPSRKKINKLLRALKACQQNPGAPVVT